MKQSDFITVIGLALAIVAVLTFSAKYRMQPSGTAGAAVGSVAPVIKAEGWVNGSAPTPEELNGKLIVLEAWATWCLPCRQKAPHFVEIYNKFQNEDVIFIGLTAEGEEQLPAINEFLNETNIEWRNGYGAVQTLTELQADYIPSAWVIDRDGTICWNSDSRQSLDDFLQQKLSQP